MPSPSAEAAAGLQLYPAHNFRPGNQANSVTCAGGRHQTGEAVGATPSRPRDAHRRYNRHTMTGVVTQLNVSNGGMPKLPVLFARVTAGGVEGDRQRNLKYHGGPDRAVCLYSEELYDELRDAGVDMTYGAVGENFTTRGLDYRRMGKGDRLKVGNGGGDADGCVIEITDVRVPCRNLKQWDVDLPELIVGRSGWVARVISDGIVRPGDVIELLPRKTI